MAWILVKDVQALSGLPEEDRCFDVSMFLAVLVIAGLWKIKCVGRRSGMGQGWVREV